MSTIGHVDTKSFWGLVLTRDLEVIDFSFWAVKPSLGLESPNPTEGQWHLRAGSRNWQSDPCDKSRHAGRPDVPCQQLGLIWRRILGILNGTDGLQSCFSWLLTCERQIDLSKKTLYNNNFRAVPVKLTALLLRPYFFSWFSHTQLVQGLLRVFSSVQLVIQFMSNTFQYRS